MVSNQDNHVIYMSWKIHFKNLLSIKCKKVFVKSHYGIVRHSHHLSIATNHVWVKVHKIHNMKIEKKQQDIFNWPRTKLKEKEADGNPVHVKIYKINNFLRKPPKLEKKKKYLPLAFWVEFTTDFLIWSHNPPRLLAQSPLGAWFHWRGKYIRNYWKHFFLNHHRYCYKLFLCLHLKNINSYTSPLFLHNNASWLVHLILKKLHSVLALDVTNTCFEKY